MREKLIKILDTHCDYAGHVDCKEDCTECLANHLIANGVTVQEWIPVKDRLPEKDGRYLIINEYGMIYDAEYSRFYKGFGEKNEFDDGTDYFMQDIGITHWMPLPALPKGE